MPATCPKCHNYVPEGEATCSHCGARLHAPQPVPTDRERSVVGTELLSENQLPHRHGEQKPFPQSDATKGGASTTSRPHPRIVAPLLLLAGIVALLIILARPNFQQQLNPTEEKADQQATTEAGSSGQADDSEVAPVPSDESEHPAEDDGEAQPDEVHGEEVPTSERPADSKYPGLIGTWVGKLQQPEGSRFCFGASEIPLVLEVKDVAENGMITADLHVCFHGHGNLENPAPSTEGDVQLDYKDIALTYSNGQIRYSDEKVASFPDKTCMLHVILDVEDIESPTPQMSGMVQCTHDLWSYDDSYGSQEDHFVLERQ